MSSTGSEDYSVSVSVSATEQKKRRRMLSNRDSARRSRMRKQQRLDDLSATESELRDGNRRMRNMLQVANHNFRVVESENRVLRTRAMELRTRLESLNSILNYMSTTAATDTCNYDHSLFSSVPWNLVVINQSMMAPALDMSFLV